MRPFTFAPRSDGPPRCGWLEFSSSEIETILKTNNLKSNNIDFILLLDNSSTSIIKMAVNKNVYLPERAVTWQEFLNYNPYALVQEIKIDNKESFYFGRVITPTLLNDLSQKINSEIAVVWDGTPTDLSNQAHNQKFLYLLTKANEYLKDKNNFEIYSDGTESTDIIAAVFKPTLSFSDQNKLYFLIFTLFGETGELRTTLEIYFLRERLGVGTVIGVNPVLSAPVVGRGEGLHARPLKPPRK